MIRSRLVVVANPWLALGGACTRLVALDGVGTDGKILAASMMGR